MTDGNKGPERNALAIVGIVLVVVGGALAVRQMGLLPPFVFRMADRAWDARRGMLVILIGVLVLVAGARPGVHLPPKGTRLYRTREGDRMLGGVLAGIARYLSVDPTIVRLIFVALVLLDFGGLILAYIVAWVLVPEEPQTLPPAQHEAPPPPSGPPSGPPAE